MNDLCLQLLGLARRLEGLGNPDAPKEPLTAREAVIIRAAVAQIAKLQAELRERRG